MALFNSIRLGASAGGDYEVERSVRNDQGSSDVNSGSNFSRTFSSGNRKIFTVSVWVKKCNTAGNIGDDQYSIFSTGGGGSGASQGNFYFNNDDTLYFVSTPQPSTNLRLITTRKFRDFSAWYHLVVAVDTTQGTASNRAKLYVNGIQETSFSTATYPSQNDDLYYNLNTNHRIGSNSLGSNLNSTYGNFNGYIAEFNFIDGSQLDPSSFGNTNPATGQWNPKKYTGSYGTNGFYLNFSDNSGTTATTLGKDSSGNGNNFTPNNFSTHDSVPDSPTNNFCIMNIHDNNLSEASPHFVYSEGNLKAAWSFTGTNFDRAYGTFFIEPSDTNKYYWEATGTQNNEQMQWGIVATDTAAYRANNRNTNPTKEANIAIAMWQPYTDNGIYAIDNSGGNYGDKLTLSNGPPANGDIFSFVYDAGAGKFYVFFKGVEPTGQNYSAGTTLFDTLDTSKTYALHNCEGDGGGSTKSGNFVMNWGQDSSFAGAKTAQGNTDANGIGDFYYSVPSGAKALCSANLPDPTIKLPDKHYNTLEITGNQSTNAITGLDFKPDWVVYKALNPESGHGETKFHDSVRGSTVGQAIVPYNSTTPPAEVTNSSYLVSFNSNGLTVGSDGVYNNYQTYNQTGRLYQALCWDAGETDGKTYTVTVVSDSGNKYRFDGFGTSAVTLDLAEGGTYIFNYPSAHPLKFSTTADGTHGGGSEYTTGVTHNSSTQVTIVVAASAPTLYYYCSSHSGMGGQVNTNSTLGSSNFAGSIQTRVKVNATAGFSLVSYTGTGSLATVGHGLGVKPDVMIIKNRNSEGHGFLVYHTKIGATKNLQLQSNSPEATASNKFNNTEPTSTVFTVNTSADGNQSSQNFISYIFSEVSGYSKFGSYVGNANANGTYVFCGFEPSFLLIKRSSSGDNNPWIGYNNKRNPFNQVNNQMVWNTTQHENIDANNCNIDFLSNGFKLRNSDGSFNGSGGIYIFLAFAESPFKNSRAR